MTEWSQMVLLAELLLEQQEHEQKQDPLARMVGYTAQYLVNQWIVAGAHRAMMFLMVVFTTEGAVDRLGPADLEGMAPAPAPCAQGGPGDGLTFNYVTGILANLNCPPDQFLNCRTCLGVPHFEIYGLCVRRR
jgi:hypothetical protein